MSDQWPVVIVSSPDSGAGDTGERVIRLRPGDSEGRSASLDDRSDILKRLGPLPVPFQISFMHLRDVR